MSRSRFQPFKPLVYAALVVAAWWIVPAAFRGMVRVSFYESQAPAWTMLEKLADLQSLWTDRTHSRSELTEAGRDLARLNAAYMLRLQQADSIDAEVKRLQELTGMPPLQGWRYLVARVVRRDLDTWWQRVVIERGVSDGVRKGQGVVCRDGVVGRVVEVHAKTSVVELVSSSAFRVAAHIEGDERPVTFLGVPAPVFKDPGGLATNIPADVSVNPSKPLRLVTSRLGGDFPDGLTIGFIRAMERDSDGLFQRGAVLLNPSLVSVQEVAVMIPVEAGDK